MNLVLWLLALGVVVYCFLVLVAVYRYLSVLPPAAATLPISILKPLKGVDLGLDENLRSFFSQSYAGDWELVFAIADENDPAAALVRTFQLAFPQVDSRLLIVGSSPYQNAKVWSLEKLCEAARYDVVVMSDSDIRVTPQMLDTIAAEFAADPKLGVATCPYRAVGGPSPWSQTEALGMNTEFIAGVLVARMLEGMRFTLGPTVAARQQAIADAGGWAGLEKYLAEDFVLGQRVTAKGWNSILSSYVVEHRIGSESMATNFAHRLRWNRSTRRSRPLGYLGQFFTNPLPVFLAVWPLTGFELGFLGAALMLRFTVAFATQNGVLNENFHPRYFYQLPLQDLLSFAFWLAGFFGNTIHWRGCSYRLHADGTFTLLQAD
ncbi:glycosyltransferase [Bryobacter aggregatus]|uniref:glycosyltransferase n=1 Tax=Bryobacter aggregatus TaxID=360054 RepID=UPI0004E21C1F|nr:glycosyltransferase [Bryobacter aggregatus]